MPKYLDTRGRGVLSVAICDRCNIKFPYEELRPDPNFPGMRVCSYDLDVYDPWRLPFLPADNHISLRFPRPDQPLGGPRVTTNNSIQTQGAPNGSPNGLPAGGASGGLIPLANTQTDSLFIDDPEGNTYGGAPGIISL
jgi:hypothetical protein